LYCDSDVPTRQAAAVVLDTNVVLDWLAFGDASAAPLAAAIEAGRVLWLATAAMRAELTSVLARPPLSKRFDDSERILIDFDRWTFLVDPLLGARPRPGLSCRDPDDQPFIDLAIACGAAWLFTRDKALLALAPAAARHGVRVLAPRRWAGLQG
jgi:putative PIN family toxin of toxin-antitoxin system